MDLPACLLVVDDDPTVIDLLRACLERQGCEIVALRRGEEVLEAVLSLRPDAVLLDVLMPGRDGYQALCDLRLHPEARTTPVVIFSGGPPEALAAGAQELGADGFLSKPFTRSALLAAIDSAIRGSPWRAA